MKILFTIGIALLLLSAYPLYLMAMELKTSNAAYERYEVSQHSGKNYQYKSADFYGHDIELSDARLVGPAKAGDNLEVIVSTTVDGKDHTLDSPIEVEIFKGTKSYNGWIAILTLKDKQLQQERLAIIQRVAGQHYPDDTRYRILFVQPDGTVTEEWFSYPERANPMYRTVLATFRSPGATRISLASFDVLANDSLPDNLSLAIWSGWTFVKHHRRHIHPAREACADQRSLTKACSGGREAGFSWFPKCSARPR